MKRKSRARRDQTWDVRAKKECCVLNIVSAVLFGIMQGIAEFLPISSSGHLAILHSFFNIGFDSTLTFDVMLHLGTLIAVVIVYFRDLCALIPAAFSLLGKVFRKKWKLADYTSDERLVLFLVIACLPLIAAAFINDYVEILSSYTKVVGGILIVNGLVLFVSDRIGKGGKNVEKTTPLNAFLVGLCQMCAILPGLSRSGSTITGGLLQGFDRDYAVKFSFLLSIPAIVGANIFVLPDMLDEIAAAPAPSELLLPALVGIVSAVLAGIAAMKLLVYISKHSNFRLFGYYCIAVGLLTVIFG